MKKDICTAIEVLEERVVQLQAQNKLQFDIIEDILKQLKTDIEIKVDSHEKQLERHEASIGFAKGAISGIVTLIGIIGIKIVGF